MNGATSFLQEENLTFFKLLPIYKMINFGYNP